ncbi:uncharacterized protein NPIL_319461 [Nephila pilipes]|uniref:DUF19 domain-containing protein n=1 Tax=Nephila pilipes TaxID=299642 RepID=A0A8X6N2F3_NEPPI|nr:uncharacterized protein NPIL_319461 [Nephila pilipes]
MLLSIVVTLLVASISTASGTKCTNFDFIVCAFLVDGEKTSTSGFAETEEDLDLQCNQTIPVLKCLSDFGSRCPDSIFKHLTDFFQTEYDTQKKICTKNDELRQRYLKFAKCLNLNRVKMEEKCGLLIEVEGSEKFNKEHCKQYENSFQCSYTEIQNSCGKDALTLEMELLKPAHDFMELSCKDFQDLHDF